LRRGKEKKNEALKKVEGRKREPSCKWGETPRNKRNRCCVWENLRPYWESEKGYLEEEEGIHHVPISLSHYHSTLISGEWH